MLERNDTDPPPHRPPERSGAPPSRYPSPPAAVRYIFPERVSYPQPVALVPAAARIVRIRTIAPLAVIAMIAGCGGASHHAVPGAITVPAYGGFAQTTIAAAKSTPAFCRRDARALAGDARLYPIHSAGTNYPADLYYMNL